MGVDVGVVNITYLDRPKEPIYHFLWIIAQGGFDEDWGGGWSGNTFAEFKRESLTEGATRWADDKGLTPQERIDLFRWIEELPWTNNHIMLHLNW